MRTGQVRKDDVIGKSVKEVFPGVVELGLFDVFQRVWQSGRSEKLTASLYQDGRINLWVENYVCKLPSGHVVAIFNDTTETKHAYEELENSEKRFRTLVDQAGDAIVLIAPDGEIVDANRQTCASLGYLREELLSMTIDEIDSEFKGHFQRTKMSDALSSDPAFTVESTNRRKDGSTFPVEARIGTLEVDDERYLLALIRDISERRQAKEQREKLEDQLRQSQKMEAIGTLAGGIAHDFNNILSGIIGAAELARHEISANSKASEEIDQVIQAATRAAGLVRQILTFSHKTDQRRQAMCPHAIIKESLKMLRATLPASIEIEQEIDTSSGMIMADPTGIHQIVMNLCANAAHAMEGGKGVLGVRLYRRTLHAEDIKEGQDVSAGPFIVIEVRDVALHDNRYHSLQISRHSESGDVSKANRSVLSVTL